MREHAPARRSSRARGTCVLVPLCVQTACVLASACVLVRVRERLRAHARVLRSYVQYASVTTGGSDSDITSSSRCFMLTRATMICRNTQPQQSCAPAGTVRGQHRTPPTCAWASVSAVHAEGRGGMHRRAGGQASLEARGRESRAPGRGGGACEACLLLRIECALHESAERAHDRRVQVSAATSRGGRASCAG
jgi:hypothetical protein